MNCQAARGLLLIAEVTDLQGRCDGELAGHLRTCERCRAHAAELVEAMAELRRDLEIPEEAGVPSARSAILEARRRHARARLLRRVVPLAAAAGLVGLLLARRGPSVVPGATPAPSAIHDVSAAAPPGRSLAVLHTDDPNIVVIWFF